VSANLTVNNAPLEVFGVSLAPGGSVTGKIVAVANLGCEAVCDRIRLTLIHTDVVQSDFPDVKGAIILVFRGSCQSAQKVALGATAGAVGAIVYNNVEGNLDGYSLQRISTPEGPYVPTGGISKADGLTLLARLAAGEEIIADLSTTTKVTTT
jgi:aminopeptidase Y